MHAQQVKALLIILYLTFNKVIGLQLVISFLISLLGNKFNVSYVKDQAKKPKCKAS